MDFNINNNRSNFYIKENLHTNRSENSISPPPLNIQINDYQQNDNQFTQGKTPTYAEFISHHERNRNSPTKIDLRSNNSNENAQQNFQNNNQIHLFNNRPYSKNVYSRKSGRVLDLSEQELRQQQIRKNEYREALKSQLKQRIDSKDEQRQKDLADDILLLNHRLKDDGFGKPGGGAPFYDGTGNTVGDRNVIRSRMVNNRSNNYSTVFQMPGQALNNNNYNNMMMNNNNQNMMMNNNSNLFQPSPQYQQYEHSPSNLSPNQYSPAKDYANYSNNLSSVQSHKDLKSTQAGSENIFSTNASRFLMNNSQVDLSQNSSMVDLNGQNYSNRSNLFSINNNNTPGATGGLAGLSSFKNTQSQMNLPTIESLIKNDMNQQLLNRKKRNLEVARQQLQQIEIRKKAKELDKIQQRQRKALDEVETRQEKQKLEERRMEEFLNHKLQSRNLFETNFDMNTLKSKQKEILLAKRKKVSEEEQYMNRMMEQRRRREELQRQRERQLKQREERLKNREILRNLPIIVSKQIQDTVVGELDQLRNEMVYVQSNMNSQIHRLQNGLMKNHHQKDTILQQIKDLRLEMSDQTYIQSLNQLNTKLFLQQEYEDLEQRRDAQFMKQAADRLTSETQGKDPNQGPQQQMIDVNQNISDVYDNMLTAENNSSPKRRQISSLNTLMNQYPVTTQPPERDEKIRQEMKGQMLEINKDLVMLVADDEELEKLKQQRGIREIPPEEEYQPQYHDSIEQQYIELLRASRPLKEEDAVNNAIGDLGFDLRQQGAPIYQYQRQIEDDMDFTDVIQRRRFDNQYQGELYDKFIDKLHNDEKQAQKLDKIGMKNTMRIDKLEQLQAINQKSRDFQSLDKGLQDLVLYQQQRKGFTKRFPAENKVAKDLDTFISFQAKNQRFL